MAYVYLSWNFEKGATTDICSQLMGIETSADLSGSECSFTSAIIAVEVCEPFWEHSKR